jgi:signal transduction histidine kinase
MHSRESTLPSAPAERPLGQGTREKPEYQTVTRVAYYVWIAVGFIFVWLHFSSVQPHLDWRVYALYFLAVSGVATRYLTGARFGRERWHRVVFDGLSILFISVGVGMTGGIRSELWLLYFILVIAETLAASARGFLITDVVAVVSYVIATWPQGSWVLQEYLEPLVTRVFFLVLVASIARTLASEERRRQEDLAALREALSVSEERRRLARDLHDGVGHVLTRAILGLEMARRDPAVGESARIGLGKQATDLRSAMEEMRQLVATLRTDTSAFDLAGTLRLMVSQLNESGSLHVDLKLPEQPLPLSPHRQYHLTRVVQEALTNCLRHSQATEAEVEVRILERPTEPELVVARISDRGAGFDPASVNGDGNGLRGMQERLEPYRGKVQIESSRQRGTTVTAELPADE